MTGPSQQPHLGPRLSGISGDVNSRGEEDFVGVTKDFETGGHSGFSWWAQRRHGGLRKRRQSGKEKRGRKQRLERRSHGCRRLYKPETGTQAPWELTPPRMQPLILAL